MSRTRWILDRTEDLELRLAPSFMSKGGTLTNNLFRSYPPNIIILDDDDDDAEEEDRQIYSSELSGPTRNLLHYSSSWAPELSEQDLELRLGLGAYLRYPQESNGGTKISERTRDPYAGKYGKKLKPKPGSCCAAPCGEEVKLRCAICMDTMKEETSTICGHVFCRPCITTAVLSQKKCPACRMKLSPTHPPHIPPWLQPLTSDLTVTSAVNTPPPSSLSLSLSLLAVYLSGPLSKLWRTNSSI